MILIKKEIFGGAIILASQIMNQVCLIYVYGPTSNNLDPYD